MTSKSTNLNGVGPAKKPYERPRLEVYGDIREVTDSVGMRSDSGDGAAHGNTKTF